MYKIKSQTGQKKKSGASPWKMTLLGCGTSSGVPLLFCNCAVCRSKDPKNQRLRTSGWFQTKGKSILIDTSTDLRQQALKNKISKIDAILFTHPHADHVSGIDEIRSFNFIQKSSIPAFGNRWTCQELSSRYPYIFSPSSNHEGGGIPRIDLNEFQSSVKSMNIAGVTVTPVALSHGREECIGYRFDAVAYVTDCSYISDESLQRLENLDCLVLDCLRIASHKTHLNLEQALKIVARLRPKKTVLTHLGHDFDYKKWSKKLPRGVILGFDGLVLSGKGIS